MEGVREVALHLPKPRVTPPFERVMLDGQTYRIDAALISSLAEKFAPPVRERISQIKRVLVAARFDGGQDAIFQMRGLPILVEWLTKLEFARFVRALESGEYAVAGAILEHVVRMMERDVYLESGWPSGVELVALWSIVDVI